MSAWSQMNCVTRFILVSFITVRCVDLETGMWVTLVQGWCEMRMAVPCCAVQFVADAARRPGVGGGAGGHGPPCSARPAGHAGFGPPGAPHGFPAVHRHLSQRARCAPAMLRHAVTPWLPFCQLVPAGTNPGVGVGDLTPSARVIVHVCVCACA